MRERQLFVNAKKAEEAEKSFKEKYGMLRSVEAGENVRCLGRVDLAFQNGDIVSIGLGCRKEDDDRLFFSIVHAIKSTAGVVLCQELRCHARRRKDSKAIHGDCYTRGSAEDLADAERHMQELLAMEDHPPKSVVETPATPPRKNQRKGKKKEWAGNAH
jgi:hypothetical protein